MRTSPGRSWNTTPWYSARLARRRWCVRVSGSSTNAPERPRWSPPTRSSTAANRNPCPPELPRPPVADRGAASGRGMGRPTPNSRRAPSRCPDHQPTYRPAQLSDRRHHYRHRRASPDAHPAGRRGRTHALRRQLRERHRPSLGRSQTTSKTPRPNPPCGAAAARSRHPHVPRAVGTPARSYSAQGRLRTRRHLHRAAEDGTARRTAPS